MSNMRLHALDSLRGIAALTVVLSHSFYYFREILGETGSSIFLWLPTRLLVSGHPAVILFFTLSGFALTFMLKKYDCFSYRKFFLARVARLYIPYIASIILAIFVYLILKHAGYVWENGWMNAIYPRFETQNIILHFFAVYPFDLRAINGTLWSIVYEIRISFIFPFIYLLTRKFGNYAVLVAIVNSIVIAYIFKRTHISSWDLGAGNILATLHYASFFVLGSYLAININKIRNVISNLSKCKKIAAWIVGLALYTYPFVGGTAFVRMLTDIPIGAGCALLICLSINISFLQTNKYLLFLGRISYSLYLNHMLVISFVTVIFYEKVGAIFSLILIVILNILIAAIMQILFEKPSINLSRAFFKKKG